MARQWREAESTYLAILAKGEAIPEVLVNLAVALKNQGKLDQAIAACRRALALQPQFPEALSNLGDALRLAKRPEEAIEIFRRVAALRPKSPEVWNNLGDALARCQAFA